MAHEYEGDEGAKIAALLGGPAILGHAPRTQLEAHDLLAQGLPGEALRYLVDRLAILARNALLPTVFGMSLRTFQRHRESPERRLTLEQSSRIWRFAAILNTAIVVFGSQEAAEMWMERPAMGLDRRRPIDLLTSAAGTEMVETFLGRLQYGVYT
jgi:putative toxin-antitoxin system antitoxin component (TIGR02293 family)